MLKSFLVFSRFVLFWILFFIIDRVIFLIYFHDKLTGIPASEIAKSFLYGLRLDLSTIGYISALPLLIYIFFWYFPKFIVTEKVIRIYVYFLIILFSLFTIINFNVYREWGSKINYKILDFFFTSTSEAIASSSSSPVVLSFSIFGLFVALSIWLSNKLISFEHPDVRVPIWVKSGAGLIALTLCFLAIRGGWQLSPVNESMSYYSSNTLLNHAAVNTEWSLLHDVVNSKYTKKNPFRYMTDEEAAAIVRSTLKSPSLSSTPNYLTTTQPNIVLILMESFTADVVESLGGLKGVSPNYEKLAEAGIAFTNIYAAGDRTDKGLIGTISGFPAQGGRSIVKQNDKQEKLPSISQELKKAGYSTSFFYGGESEFSNQKSFILSHGYEKLIDKKDFPNNEMNSKWGAYDGTVYNRMLSELSSSKAPFFSTVLTLTNHEPFELPVKSQFLGEDLAQKFKSTSHYADASLGDFIKNAAKTSWYKNTLFIVIADHGHRLPIGKYENYDPHRYRIPLLLFGEVIKPKYRGTKIEKIGSQTDLAQTVLHQVNLPTGAFNWGKDLLNPHSTEFAFYNWDGGFGVVTKNQSIAFDAIGGNILFKQNKELKAEEDDELLQTGKAFMQAVYQQYINY